MGKAWDAGRKVGRWDPEPMSSEDERRIQKGIDDTMRAVIADRKYDPYALDTRPEKVVPVGAVKLAEDPLPVPLLPGAPTPGNVPWDWIRLGAKPKWMEEEEEKARAAREE
jgi:hypothetical protein